MKKEKIEINLTGPQGNAFYILRIARDLSKHLGLDMDLIQSEMMSSDYDNLINVFEKYFGEHVILYR